jgi:hypothetical protein
MKKIILLFVSALLLAAFIAGRFFDEQAKNILKVLQLSEDDAQTEIFSAISGPVFYFPHIKELKSVAEGDRAVTVQVIGKNVKEYTATEEFINQYNQYRETQKPSPPEKPESAAEMKKEHIDGIKKNIEEMKVTKSQVSADQQSMYDDIILSMEEQLTALEDPDNPMYSPEMDEAIKQGYEQEMEQYNLEIKKWEEEYPLNNPKLMLKTWLETFLEQTNDVDFNAQTAIDENGRTLFVKQDYESKNYLWKLCFRGGKETTDAGRSFAQGWLNELK